MGSSDRQHDQVFQKVSEYVKAYDMIPPDCSVIAAVSGGTDSMAMLDLLVRLRGQIEFSLSAVHVNHGIRGEEAESDTYLVEQVCRAHSVPCHVYRKDIPALASAMKTGEEEAGRHAREEAYADVAAKTKGPVRIAVAHNQNDLAETVLHHLARGTGLAGLCSLRPVSGDKIRPVMCLEKEEILDYIQERQISYGLDRTNLEDKYTRNRIRHHVIPLLEAEVNPQTVRHIAETAAQCAEAVDYLAELGQKIVSKAACTEEGMLLGQEFLDAPEPVRPYAVMAALEKLGGRKDVAADHIRSVSELIRQSRGKTAILPGMRRAVRVPEGVFLYGPGRFENAAFPEGKIKTRIFPYSGEKIVEKKYTKWMDYDKIKGTMQIRTRKTGDYMTIDAAGRHKKLTRIMMDDGIPAAERDRTLLVVCESEILWIAGGRMAENVKVGPGTTRVLEISFEDKSE